MKENFFNVRVYGILINDQRQLLVSDEYRFGKKITKFPGGGLRFGEGTLECIRREMMEETGMKINVIQHFYTTDFFQESAFHENQQVISIYYLIQPTHEVTIKVKDKIFDFDSLIEGAQVFRWIPIESMRKEDFTFPIDQKVGDELRMLQFTEEAD